MTEPRDSPDAGFVATFPRRPTDRWSAAAATPAVLGAAAVGLVLGLAYLAAPLMGADLSAQFARADFAGAHPLAPIDFRWFGGTLQFGYSLWTPAVMSVLGVRTTGVLAEIASVALFTYLVQRGGSPRPMWAGGAAAVTLSANLVEGRITFACGVAFGLAALALLPNAAQSYLSTGPVARPLPAAERVSGQRVTGRRVAAGVAAVIAGAASPVATLLLLVAAVALAARRRFADSAVLLASVLPLLIISVVFADGGRQLFGANDAARAIAATALVIVFVPNRFLTVRLGAVAGLLMVVAAVVLPTQIGSNSTRLSLLFAVPVVVAFATMPRWPLPLAVAVVVLAQPPLVLGTLRDAGSPATQASYYRPLQAELAARGALTGRIEVPELIGHWDAMYLARHVWLARGWLRQVDTELNGDVFYDHPPTAQSYRAFLDRTAVRYVAVADARASFYGRREKRLIDSGLDYLSVVWRNQHWTLYAVSTPVPIVAAPGVLQHYTADRISVAAPAQAEIIVRIRWSRWLRLDGPGGACLRERDGQVQLRTRTAGSYTLSSSLTGRVPQC